LTEIQLNNIYLLIIFIFEFDKMPTSPIEFDEID